jgi:hypothetical protein
MARMLRFAVSRVFKKVLRLKMLRGVQDWLPVLAVDVAQKIAQAQDCDCLCVTLEAISVSDSSEL